MRVAFVSFGFGEYAIRLASALAESVDVALWISEWQAQPHTRLLSPAVDFRPFPKPRLRQPIRQLKTMRWLRGQIAEFSPDLIHLQQGYLWFNPTLAFLRDYPLVVTIHDPTPHVGDKSREKTPQAISNIAYRLASRIIVHNRHVRDVMVEMGIAPEALDIVPTVVRGHPGIGSGQKEQHDVQVLFFGRIWEYKGLEYLIKAEPAITSAVPDARIVIAGQGEDFSRYQRMMVNPDRFIVHNEFVSEEKKDELFASASVIALPYIDATQSAVIATAYNYAKPVVATAVGGLPSMVDDGETGLLIPPRDEQALASAIIRLLKDREMRERLGVNARAKAEAEYGAEVAARHTLEAYRRALSA